MATTLRRRRRMQPRLSPCTETLEVLPAYGEEPGQPLDLVGGASTAAGTAPRRAPAGARGQPQGDQLSAQRRGARRQGDRAVRCQLAACGARRFEMFKTPTDRPVTLTE